MGRYHNNALRCGFSKGTTYAGQVKIMRPNGDGQLAVVPDAVLANEATVERATPSFAELNAKRPGEGFVPTPAEEVRRELAQCRILGMRVPPNYAEYLRDHASEIADYRNAGMKISEIADLVCQLA